MDNSMLVLGNTINVITTYLLPVLSLRLNILSKRLRYLSVLSTPAFSAGIHLSIQVIIAIDASGE